MGMFELYARACAGTCVYRQVKHVALPHEVAHAFEFAHFSWE